MKPAAERCRYRVARKMVLHCVANSTAAASQSAGFMASQFGKRITKSPSLYTVDSPTPLLYAFISRWGMMASLDSMVGCH